MSELILHHYPMSPFSHKVRTVFGFKRLDWKSVIIPAILPKPDVHPGDLGDLLQVGQQVAVGEHGALADARCASCVLEQGQIAAAGRGQGGLVEQPRLGPEQAASLSDRAACRGDSSPAG